MRALVTFCALALSNPSDEAGAGARAGSAEAEKPLQNWPQWRGPLGTGAAPEADPPTAWGEGRNVRWKTRLPGRGSSTPVVWGRRIFLTTAIPYGEPVGPFPDRSPGGHDNLAVTHRHRFVVLAVDRQSGAVVWERAVREEVPHEGGHYSGSLASHSPVTDGGAVFAFFGSRGLFALDFEGNSLWHLDLGDMQSLHGHGEGSSPALHADTLVINWDHEGQSFVAAFDKRTGTERWRVERDEVTSWATPIVVEHGGRAQVVVSGTKRVRSYDLANGKALWECGGLSRNVVASPVAAGGMVFAGSSYDTQALIAIRLDGAQGDITGTDRVVWSRRRLTPYVPSPLLYDGYLYFLRHYQGILSRVVASTGEERHGPFRLSGIRNVYASPLGAAGRIYVTDQDGTTLVLSHREAGKILAQNQLDDSFSASAVAVDRVLLLRGEHYLYCIGETSGEEPPREPR